ncbi:TRIC cation channel family protein [Streptomyces sp. TRM 70361]|uniref:trimeric intracellular cation channel family protein n=1 Tax=Streptomyces sp. TRM 70361 TaxID=3116553 RepID=UPI002E7BD56C|nr:TRIC cation channel family protein [Streptomyces sp. TRM 70361]MEE1940624.1 TRIC cation channel family protein [Streptomyces sp. TRM 70361]
MALQQLLTTVQYPLDLVCVFAAALSGAVLATRKDFDLFGTLVLAEAAGLGGGLFRDLVIGVKPIAFTDPGFWLAPLAATVVVYFSTPIQHSPKACDVFDAVALGVLSVTGTIKGLAFGFAPVAAMALGMATAVGGGMIANVLAREVPPVLRWDRDLYSLPALLGGGATLGLYAAGLLNVSTAVGATVLAVTVRLAAIHYGWRTPRSRLAKRSVRPAASPHPAPAVPAPVSYPSPSPLGQTLPRPRFSPEDTVQLRLPRDVVPLRPRRPRRDPRADWSHRAL